MSVKLGKDGIINEPNLILQARNFKNIGVINHFTELDYKNNFNSANEISFTIYKDDNLEHWDEITNNKLIYVPDYKERFNLSISFTDEQSIFKKVTGTSLCESELSQLLIKNIEINTENDIIREGYSNVWDNYDVNFPTVFYRDWEHPEKYDWTNRNGQSYNNYTLYQKQMVLFHSSLLHRLLSKAPHYTIGHIDSTLWNIQRTFTFSDTDLYSALSDTIANEIGCIFKFDSLTRTINVYDIYSTCNDCEYRGDFSDTCPECKSTNVYGQYGEDTTILVDKENLASSISLESKDSLKNTFYVEGGDDVINSAIRMCNPNGTQSIIYCSEEMLSEMPVELSNKIKTYETNYNNSLNKNEYYLDVDVVENYNKVVNYVKEKFSSDESIVDVYDTLPLFSRYGTNYSYLKGYKEVSKYIYQAIDLYYFISKSMMPTINIDGLGIDDSLQNIIDGFKNGLYTLDENGNSINNPTFKDTIAVSSPAIAITSTVNNTIKNTAKLFCSTAYYDISVSGNYQYNVDNNSGEWSGTITITSLTETDDDTGNKKNKTANLELKVIDDMDLFISQQICYATYYKDNLEITQILGLDMPDNIFKQQLKLYSLDELNLMLNKFESCLGVINNLKDSSSKFTGSDGEKLIQNYYTFYHNRINYITEELLVRDEQIKAITDVYSFDNNEGALNVIKSDIQELLNFETYLGEELYKTFCAYRMEDTYSNSNYISDGLSDSELVEYANKLLELAKKELYKAATPQWTLTATIGNLLLMDEFKPIINHFNVGNWIRVRIENNIYKLRLLSYTISYTDLTQISVEFSTVEKVYNSISDVNSVMESVSSISTSYSYIEKQAEKTNSLDSMYKQWVNEGLNATQIKYVNADNQTLIIDENGLLARAWDFELNDYSPYQLKIVNNGLYTTHDSWNSIDSGIGRISYYDPILKKNVEDYGVIAKTLVGHLILGENLVIANCNDENKSTVTIDANGITLDSGYIKWTNKLGLKDLDDESKNTIDKAVADITANAQNLKNFINGEFKSAEDKITQNAKKITEEEQKRKEAYDTMDKSVAKYLGLSGGTLVGSNYIISPYIGGGYLSIVNEKNKAKVVIDPAAKNVESTKGDLISATYGNEKIFCIDSSGSAYFKGSINATSLTLGSNCIIKTKNIDGLSNVATSGKYGDLIGNPDLTVYETKSNVDEKLKGYAMSGDLKAYLKTDNLSSKLGELDVAYRGDVEITQTTDAATGLITTTSSYTGSDGKKYTNKTYTYNDSNYVLLNRENQWGSGDSLVKISKDGLLIANNAVIHGTVYATDGKFSGTIISNEGEIGGWEIIGGENGSGIQKVINKRYIFPVWENGNRTRWWEDDVTISSIVGMISNGDIGFETQGYDDIGHTSVHIVNGGIGFYRAYNEYSINEKTGEFITMNKQINKNLQAYMSIYTTPLNALKYFGRGVTFNGNKSDSVVFMMDKNNIGLEAYITLNRELPSYSKTAYALYRKDISSIILHKPIESLDNIYNHGNMVFTTDDGNGLWCRLNSLSTPTTVRMIRSNYDSTNKYYTLNISDNNFQYTCLYGKTVKLQGTSGATVTSDERLKNSFKSLDEFDDVFMDIKPCGFKYNNGTSGRTHFGAKAQNIKEAFEKHGYTTKDFAGFVQMTDDKSNENYCGIDDPMGLIYTEFTMWNTHMIQKTIKENMKIKERISKLEALLK